MAKHLRNPFVISSIFLIFSIVFLSIFFNKISRDNLSEQIQHRQQLAVRSGAKSIGSFLRGVGRSVAVLSYDPDQDKLDMFIESWKDVGVAGVISIDGNGRIIAASNRENKKEIGATVIERGYFKWAQTAKRGEYLVDSPVISKIGPTKDKYIITISSPVIDQNEKFNGVVTSAILVEELINIHLEDIKVLNSSKIYLVSSNEEIIYSDNNELTGKEIKDIFNTEFLGKKKILEILSIETRKDDETKIKLAIPNLDNGFGIESYFISASPIVLGDNLWKVVISVPEKDLNVFTYSFFNKQIVAVFFVVTVFILLTLRASRSSGYQEAVDDEHKKHNIQN